MAVAIIVVVGLAGYVTLESTSSTFTGANTRGTSVTPSTSTSYYSTTGSATTSWCQAVGRVNYAVSSGNISLGGPAAYDSRVGKFYVTGASFNYPDPSESNYVYVIDPRANSSSVVSILTGTLPTDIVYDPNNSALYVADYGSNSVAVINDSTNSVIDNIPVEKGPIRIAYDPSNQEIYVSNRFSGTVSVINTTLIKVVSNINVSSSPFEITYDALNHGRYVTDGGQSNVTVINSSSNKVAGSFSVDMGSGLIVYDYANTHLYFFPQDSQGLYVIDSTTNKVIANVSGIYDLNAMGYDPANQNIYVAGNASGGFVTVVSSSNNSVVASITGNGWTPVDFVPLNDSMYLTSYGDTKIYALSSGGMSDVTCQNPSSTQIGDETTVITEVRTTSNETCTPAATITQANSTEVLTLCHTLSYSSSSAKECSTTFPNGTDIDTTVFLAPSSGSSASFCVKFYYYNSTSTDTIYPLDQMTIFSPTAGGTLRNANSSFAVSSNVSQFQIGGPKNVDEGLVVAYTISSTGSTPSGTYEIALSSGLFPMDVICAYGIYVDLQVGNSTNFTVGSSCHYVPSPTANPGLVYTEIVGVTNST
ncbi:MAG: YncE family protein [Nitrososphaerales archaeon]